MSGARLAGVALLVLALAGTGSYLAGEQTEVVVLRTFDGEGKPHDTKLWAVDHEGTPWVRVANPEREWFRRLRTEPRAQLIRNGTAQAVVADPQEGVEARAAIDRLFREKYRIVDCGTASC